MSIQQDCVVSLHYTLKGEDGAVIDSSTSGQPLSYLHGHGQLVSGLERELQGKSAGDRLDVKLAPADGYGDYDAKLVERVPRRTLKGLSGIEVGMKLRARTQAGPRTVTVTRVAGDMVTLDANHPLAGRTLRFEVEITDVREATAEELAHGHAHGPGEHHH